MKIKFIYTLLLFILVVKVNFAQEVNPNGYNKFYYDNGVLSSEGNMREGKPDGYWKNYYKTGKLKSEGNRKDFQLDSLWRFYNESGKLVTEFWYKAGKKDGYKNSYNQETGKLETSEEYHADIKDGFTLYFSGKDTLSKKVPFVKGREEGTGYEFEKDGRVVSILTYKNGFLIRQEKINRIDEFGRKQGMWKVFYENNTIKIEVKYTDNLYNGYYKEYNEKGQLIKTIKYQNGIEVKDAEELVRLDVKTEYYDTGLPKVIVTMKNGLKEGVERSYSETGEVIASKIFKNGQLIGEGLVDPAGMNQGPWKEYYADGTLKAKGEYKDNKRIGPWEFYHPDGSIEQIGKYTKSGKPDGVWKWYYSNKQLRREENYNKGKEEGDFVEYDELGNVMEKGQYVEGLEDGKWLYEYGDYKEEGEYKNGNREGLWRGYFKTTGKIAFETSYVDGNENGKYVLNYAEGYPRIEGNYVMGKKEGYWKYYTEMGLILLTEYYENDELIKVDGVKVKSIEKNFSEN